MALSKLCRCGKIIDFTLKCCEQCEIKARKEHLLRQKEYDRHARNKESQAIYNNTAWLKINKRIRVRDKGLCIACYKNNRITYCNVVHHIVPVNEDMSLVYSSNNLISLCNKCHSQVHMLYNTKDKENTQRLLRNLIE